MESITQWHSPTVDQALKTLKAEVPRGLPETEIARRQAPDPVDFLSRLTYMPTRVLSYSTDVVLKLLGSVAVKRSSISPEEIELFVKQGTAEGFSNQLKND